MLVLPALPCEDDAETANACKAKTEIVKQTGPQEGQEHNDSCSPFCHCTCCACFSINHFFAGSTFLIFPDTKAYISYLPENINEVSYSIWQPPKIS